MDPMLAKRIYMEDDGLFRGSFDILVEGDWTNDNDGNTACGQNDCEELNITLWLAQMKSELIMKQDCTRRKTQLYSICC